MKQKIALVTGSNKGIGFAVVKELAKANYEVWIATRNPELGEKAAKEVGENVHFLKLDVTSDESVQAAAKEFSLKRDYLDLLINNAGIFEPQTDASAQLISLDTIHSTFNVNFLGPIRVTQAFLPFIKKSASGSILNVSSGLGSLGLQLDPSTGFDQMNIFAYNSSKTALNAFSVILSNELKESRIKVNSICPGYVATDLNGHSGPLTTKESAEGFMEFINNNDFITGKFIKKGGEHPW
jgi:NAD(P)-dependent dehydrogenase (short-subunit alcohol dehydrogenase family)